MFNILRDLLLINLPIQSFDTSINRCRKSILEIFNRFHNNDALRPVAGDIMNICHHVMNEDNEDNALIALKVLIDIHRTFRPTNESSLIAYFEIVIKTFRNLPQVIRSHMIAATSPLPSATSTGSSIGLAQQLIPVAGMNTFAQPTGLTKVKSTESLQISATTSAATTGMNPGTFNPSSVVSSTIAPVVGTNSSINVGSMPVNPDMTTSYGMSESKAGILESVNSATGGSVSNATNVYGNAPLQVSGATESSQDINKPESMKAKTPMIRGLESCKLATEYPMLLMIFANIVSYQKITHKALPSLVNNMIPMLDMPVQSSPNMTETMKEQYKNILTAQVSSIHTITTLFYTYIYTLSIYVTSSYIIIFFYIGKSAIIFGSLNKT